MTELLIDGKRVSLPSDLSFDLIFENPYFTKSSTHTLDVDLPMPTNRHVFGMLHRMDVTKQKVTLPAVLIVDGYQLLNGKALVLGTTDQTVKIQLMSGNAEFNFLTNGDIYLDEVDWANDDYTYTNGYYLSYIKTEDVLSGPGYMDTGETIVYPDRQAVIPAEPVPYLTKLVRVIVEHFGFEMGTSYLDDTWMRHIFCVGGTTLERNSKWHYKSKIRCWGLMPHWTVKDFFSHLEEFAGVIMMIDDKTHQAMLIDMNTFFLENSVQVDEVIDEYETDIESENDAESNVTMGNTGYDLPSSTNDGYNRLENRIVITAESKKAADYNSLVQLWEKDSEPVRLRTIYKTSGRSYITKDGQFTEVDLYGNLIRDTESTEVDNSLRFVPAAIVREQVNLYKVGEGQRIVKAGEFQVVVPVSYYDSSPIKNHITNIQEVIEGNEQLTEKSSKDIMELAVCPGMKSFAVGSYQLEIPAPFMDYTQKSVNQAGDNEMISLSLHEVCEQSMGARHRSLMQISSAVTYKIDFLLDSVPDVRKPFIIHCQKYFAKQIKVTVTADGFGRLMQGEFYKIEI